MNETMTCKQCGKQWVKENFQEAGSPHAHGFCGERCENEYNLKIYKPRGEKILRKWKKDIEKRQAKIDNLEDALRGSDSSAIAAAMRGGNLATLWKIIKFIVFLPAIFFWLCVGALVVSVFTGNSMRDCVLGNNAKPTVEESTPDRQPIASTNDVGAVAE